jgi:chitinase
MLTATDFDCQTGSTTYNCGDINDHTGIASEATTTLTLRDTDGYITALTNAGLSPDWVTYGDYEKDHEYLSGGRGNINHKYKFANFPVQNTSMVVPNPKDVVTQGLGSIPNLRMEMKATMLEMMLGAWVGGSTSDPAQVYSTPVFLLMEAVDNMAQAKAAGKEEQKQEADEEKRKKDFILLIVSVVLMVRIPHSCLVIDNPKD